MLNENEFQPIAAKRKKYDRIFKEKAVLLSYEKISLKNFAEEIGVLPCLITRWRQDYEKFGTASFQGSGRRRVHPDKKKSFELEKKFKESQHRFEILKKGSPYLFKGNLILYQFIKNNEKRYPIRQMCEVLEVGISAYIRWKLKGISKKQQQISLLKKDIISIFFNFKKYHGANTIAKELNSRGYKISSKQVLHYMRQLGLRRIRKRKFKITTDSKHNYYIAPNILNRNFKVNAASMAWVSDITYIHTTENFLYLTIILDLFDRKIIGWSLSSDLSTYNTTLAAWEMAVINRKVSENLVFHSDRGVQYANQAFSNKLNSYNCIRSMSRKWDSCDNAVSESFFNTIKRELIHRQTKLLNKKQMEEEIFEFIENWYNKKRIHSTLNYQTIEQFNSRSNINT